VLAPPSNRYHDAGSTVTFLRSTLSVSLSTASEPYECYRQVECRLSLSQLVMSISDGRNGRQLMKEALGFAADHRGPDRSRVQAPVRHRSHFRRCSAIRSKPIHFSRIEIICKYAVQRFDLEASSIVSHADFRFTALRFATSFRTMRLVKGNASIEHSANTVCFEFGPPVLIGSGRDGSVSHVQGPYSVRFVATARCRSCN
jgi:hypothetical protein